MGGSEGKNAREVGVCALVVGRAAEKRPRAAPRRASQLDELCFAAAAPAARPCAASGPAASARAG